MPTDPDMPSSEKRSDENPSSSSSSSSSGSSTDTDSGSGVPSAADAPGPKGQYDDDGGSAPKPKEKRKKVPPPQTDTERVDEDLSIAKYYGQSGNKMGAYLRAKDAVKTQPDYPETHFVLGEAARRLGKNDEALAEFTLYLKLAPDGERAKAAEKALEGLR
jgi:tetratricopeptide (TPR) repeat protein